MPGKRITNPSLINTTFPEAVANSAELLTDWNGLVWARPIPISLIGNSWFQGSYDSIVWDNYIKDDHNYLQVSTDGGITWRLIDLTGSGDGHPPVTIGSPDGGLVISGDDTQILTLNSVTYVNPGVMIPWDKWKLDQLRIDWLANLNTDYALYKDYVDSPDNLTRTHRLRTLSPGTGIALSYVDDTIVISTGGVGSGEANTGHNDGSLGVGVFDRMNGTILEFRNLHSAGDILTVTLDDVLNNIALEVVEANIDHNVLENYVINEHIDHSTVSILTEEGIKGGGDITTTRTLSLDFPTLTSKTTIDDTDIFALYSVDEHFKIAWSDFKLEIKEYTDTFYVPLTRGVFTNTGLTGGGLLTSSRTIGLAFNDLPTVAFDPAADYLAIYDGSNGNHAKILLSSVTSVNISSGDGMDFTTITGTGTVTMGTPSTLTETTTNEATGTTHTHIVDLSTWEIEDLGDVPEPTPLYYLRRNAANTACEWIDPAIGASTPGLPLQSIQFNKDNVFTGNAGLLYMEEDDEIYFTDANASAGNTFFFGASSTEPFINRNANAFILSNFNATNQYIQLMSNRLLIGDVITETDYYIGITDPNTSPFDYTLRVRDNLGNDTMMLKNSGDVYLPALASGVEDNVLYFDTATGLITYGAKPTIGAGGILTLTADIVSGLTVNGGSTSSASTIDLDVNDNRLAVATITLSDIIGFWDVSASGDYKQRKTTLAEFPGWILSVDGGTTDEIKLGSQLNIEAGNNVTLDYNSTTNNLVINATGDGGTGDYPDLKINGSVVEEDFPTINFIEGDNISITYSAPGGVVISADPYFPPYTHISDAFIAFNRNLYTYDISESTAQRLINAPNANWTSNGSFGDGDYIFTSSGTTLYRYTISTDSTVSVNAANNDIQYIVNASDGVYVLCTGRCYHVNKDTMVATDYGNTGTNAVVVGAKQITYTTGGDDYIAFIDQSNDRWHYKKILADYSGSASDTWSLACASPDNVLFWNTATYNGIGVAIDVDNVGYVYESWDTMVGGDCSRFGYYMYDLPSGHTFDPDGADAIYTKEVTPHLPLNTIPTVYALVEPAYAGDNVDRGIYVAKDAIPFDQNYGFEQAVNGYVFDIHTEHVAIPELFGFGANVIVGGSRPNLLGSIGQVHFHSYTEDPKQFTTKDVYEVDYGATHATIVEAPITFVYYNSTYTAGGIPPKEITVITAYPIEDIAFDFNDVTGEAQTYILDLEASYNYTILEAVLQSDATVAVTVNVDATTVITDSATTSIGTFVSGDSVSTGSQVTLNLAASSATLIRGKLRVKRV